MAWRFVHDATNIVLSVSLTTAAFRVMADVTRSGERYLNVEAARDALLKRRESECKRYNLLYGVDIDDMTNYDFIIITDDAKIDHVVTLIVDLARHTSTHRCWNPKERLV